METRTSSQQFSQKGLFYDFSDDSGASDLSVERECDDSDFPNFRYEILLFFIFNTY